MVVDSNERRFIHGYAKYAKWMWRVGAQAIRIMLSNARRTEFHTESHTAGAGVIHR